jgi:membrane associated rhomboid family serine protease
MAQYMTTPEGSPIQSTGPLWRPGRLFTPVVTALILLNIACYVMVVTPGGPGEQIPRWFGFSLGSALGNLMLWQLFTYPLVSGCLSGLLFFAFLMLFFASALERQWGSRWFLIFFLVASAVTGLVRALPQSGVVLVGSTGFGCAVLAAFGWVHRYQNMFIFFTTVRASRLVMVLLFIVFLQCLPAPMNLLWLAGIPLGVVFARMLETKQLGSISPKRSRISSRFSGIDLGD